MTVEETWNELLPFVLAADEVEVVIAALGDSIPVLRQIVIDDELAGEFSDAVIKAVPDSGEAEIIPYDPIYKPSKHEWMYLRLDEADDVGDVVEEILDSENLDHFHGEDEILDDLLFYAVTMTMDEEERAAVCFRNYSEKKELGRRGGFAAFLSEGHFNKVTYKTFLFDDDVDCIAWDEFVFIKHPYQFHRIFRFFEQLRERADEIIDQVAAAVPISNEDAFREACRGQMTMMSKLASISRQPYLASLTFDVIRQVIDKAGVDVTVVEENGQEKLLFETGSPAKRWAILKLLDDDFLQSLMTEKIYEANSKRPR